MNLRRTGKLTAAVFAALSVSTLAACKPLLHPAQPTVAAPAGATLSVSSTTIARLATVEVGASGCGEDFQFVEVRLVTGTGDERTSTVVTTGWGSEPTPVTVPAWMPQGPASIEASCLEPNMSGASDGAEIEVFTYAPVPVTVAAAPAPEPVTMELAASTTGSTLHLSGTGCGGRVLVRVARGPWKVASSSAFHYGSTLLTAEADGSWSADLPLRYSVGSFSDPVAPGTMTAFAVCEGEQYVPVTFEVRDTAPPVHIIGAGPGLLYLSQCPEQNTVGALGLVELADGTETFIARNQPGGGYGETFLNMTVPADAVAVTWFAGCSGRYDPWFVYQSVHWAA